MKPAQVGVSWNIKGWLKYWYIRARAYAAVAYVFLFVLYLFMKFLEAAAISQYTAKELLWSNRNQASVYIPKRNKSEDVDYVQRMRGQEITISC